MNREGWLRIIVTLALLALTTGKALAEPEAIRPATRDFGGGHYTIGAGWTNPSEIKEEDSFSGTLFEPAEETARGIYQVNEGLFKGTDLLPTWEEIKKEGALKKTFYF